MSKRSIFKANYSLSAPKWLVLRYRITPDASCNPLASLKTGSVQEQVQSASPPEHAHSAYLLIDNDILAHMRVMHNEGCEIRLIAIGDENHLLWNADSEINLVPFFGTSRSPSGYRLELDTDTFNPMVWISNDLLSGVPWACESSVEESGVYYFGSSSNYIGDRYVASSGDSVDANGLASLTSDAQLDFYLPIQGASFTLTGSFTGTLKTLDYSGATITTYNKNVTGTDVTGTIDDGTWTIKVTVNTSTTTPKMLISSPGDSPGNRVGGCIDCSDLDATQASPPAWTS